VALRGITEPNLTDVSTHFNLRSQLDHLLTSANRILCGVRCRGIKHKFSVTLLVAMRLSNFKRYQPANANKHLNEIVRK